MKQFMLILALVLSLAACKKEETTTTPDTSDPGPAWSEKYTALAGIFEGEGIGAACNVSDDVVVFFNVEGTRFAWLEDAEIQWVGSVNDATSPFEDCPISNVGAAVITNSNRFYVYDLDGENYVGSTISNDLTEGWMNPDLISWYSSTSQTYQWGDDGTNPFGTIGAMWRFSNTGSDCFDASESSQFTWMLNGNGTKVSRYDGSNGEFDEELPLSNWTAENNCGGPDGLLPFESVGAACRIVYPNMIQDVFFNSEGTQFCYYSVSEGVLSEVFDLY